VPFDYTPGCDFLQEGKDPERVGKLKIAGRTINLRTMRADIDKILKNSQKE